MGTKIKSSEISVTSANTVSDARNVRVFAENKTLLTIRTANNEVIGSITMPAGSIEVIEKNPTDTVSANVAVLAAEVGYN